MLCPRCVFFQVAMITESMQRLGYTVFFHGLVRAIELLASERMSTVT